MALNFNSFNFNHLVVDNQDRVANTWSYNLIRADLSLEVTDKRNAHNLLHHLPTRV